MKPEDIASEEFEEHVRSLITTACWEIIIMWFIGCNR
jgi:hypothetical protein